MQTKSQALNLIQRAYTALDFLNGMTAYRDRCFDMAEAEEKQHRSGFREFGWGITRTAAAQLFTVQRIAQALDIKSRQTTIADVIRFQPSAVYAASLAANFGPEIRAAFDAANITLTQLLALDYCALVEVKQPIEA